MEAISAKQDAFQRQRNHVLAQEEDFRAGLVAKHEAEERRQRLWTKKVKDEQQERANSLQQQRNERTKALMAFKHSEKKKNEYLLREKLGKTSPGEVSVGRPGSRSPSARNNNHPSRSASAPGSRPNSQSRSNTAYSDSRPTTAPAGASLSDGKTDPHERPEDDIVLHLKRGHQDRNRQMERAQNLVRNNEKKIEAYKRKLVASNNQAALEVSEDRCFEESTIHSATMSSTGSRYQDTAARFNEYYSQLSGSIDFEAMERKKMIMERRQKWLVETNKINDELWEKSFKQKTEDRVARQEMFRQLHLGRAKDMETSSLTAQRRAEAEIRVQAQKIMHEGEAKKMENSQIARQRQAAQNAQRHRQMLMQLAKDHDQKVKEKQEFAAKLLEDTVGNTQLNIEMKNQRSQSVLDQNFEFLAENSKLMGAQVAEKCQKAQLQKEDLEHTFRKLTREAMEGRLEKSASKRKMVRPTLAQRREDTNRRRKEGTLGTSKNGIAELRNFLSVGDDAEDMSSAQPAEAEAFADRVRKALRMHMAVIGANPRDLYRMMDLNNNGQVSFSEFQAGLEMISFDPAKNQLDSMQTCFQALTDTTGLLLLHMLLGSDSKASEDKRGTEQALEKASGASKKRHVKRLYEQDDKAEEERRRGGLMRMSSQDGDEMAAQAATEDSTENESDQDEDAAHALSEDDFLREVEDGLRQGQARAPSRTRSGKAPAPTRTVSQALVFLESKRLGMSTLEAVGRAHSGPF